MTLSKGQKQKLKRKLRAAKHATVTEGIDSKFFVPANKSSTTSKPLSIEYKLPPLPPNLLQDAMNMFEENMEALYRNSSWGLNLDEKRDELSHKNARFLLVYNNHVADDEESSELVGYCHFRFENDDEDDPTEIVVYVYELQVSSKYQHCGIGQRLMERTHEIARKAGLKKLMLTVFNANNAAQKFYKKLGYAIDNTSPISTIEHQSDYEIMSIVLDQTLSERSVIL